MCACVSSLLFWQQRKWCANECVKYVCVRTCKLRNKNTIDTKTTVRSAAWRNMLHSPDRFIPVLTAIRVAPALKIFCQCYIEDKSKHTRSNASCIHTHCKPVAPSSPQQRYCFRTAWTFFYLCHRDAAITLTPTTMFHSGLVWLSLCSG